MILGLTDGNELGPDDGSVDGTVLGITDGNELGVDDGSVLGLSLGKVDGKELGGNDGVVEGSVLGADDGSLLGILLGRADSDGAVLGNALGTLDGQVPHVALHVWKIPSTPHSLVPRLAQVVLLSSNKNSACESVHGSQVPHVTGQCVGTLSC